MANMMKLTVKTLDSFNHIFQVEAESTVEQFKHQIREKLGLEIERQRLIFCGRVLQDDQKLTDCGVNDGKCLHLVQRPPPSPPSRRRERQRERERERENARREAAARQSGGSPLRHHIRHLLANPPDLMFDQQPNMSMTPTNGRMEFIRRMITEIRESMEALRGRQNLGGSGETGEASFEPMDVDSEQNEVPLDLEGFENDDEEDNDDPPGSGTRGRRGRTTRVTRARYSRPRDLGQLLEELDLLHDDFAPYRAQYVAALRDLNIIAYPEPERAQRQHTVTLICDVMHSFAHAYHAISDITFHVGQRYPRLTSEPPVPTRYPMPMQAHINVVTTTGRRAMSGDGRAARAPTGNTTTPAPAPAPTPAPAATVTPTVTTNVTSTPAPNTSAGQEERDTFNVRRSGAADSGIPTGTPIHTTTSTFTHATEGATPRRYQVEIETRGHIAFPIDNSLLNGLAAVASNLHQAEQTQEEFARHVESLVTASASADPSVSPSLRDRGTRSVPVTRAERRSERVPRPPHTPSYLSRPLTLLEDMHPSAPTESDSSASSTPPPEGERRSSSMPSIVPPSADEEGDAAQRESQPTAQRSRPHVPGGQTRHEHGREGARPEANAGLEANRTEQERPPALSDLENLLRSLSQNGGVEVVMSMDEMPNFMQSNMFGADTDGVYVTTNQGGGLNHTTEFLHNVIANVVRQNIGGAFLVQGQNVTRPNQGRSQSQPQAQSQRQTNTTQRQAQSQRPATNQGQTTNQRQTPGQGQTPNQGQNQGQGSDQGPNQQNRNAGRRPPWQPPRVVTGRRNDRVHSLMMACMVYDRYMQCDSQYARRHLQERREHYQQQAEAQERNRAARAPAPVLEVLMSRNRRFSPSHMEVMMRLLGGPVCEEGQLNAFMITIARHLFLDPMNEHPNDPTSMPSEFPFIRMQLREYVQGMLETAIETGGRSNTFEAVTERVIAQNLDFLRSIPREHVPLMVDLAMLDDGFTGGNAFDPIADHYVDRLSDFLRNMGTITPIDMNIDTTASVRVMTRSRLPAIIACVMSEASSDMFAARFYSVFARFFTDMCTLFLCFCTEGFQGLLLVYDAFFARITENYEPVTRDWLRTISRENLLVIRDNLEPNIESTARQYFRRADGSMPSPPESRSGNAAEETAQGTPSDEEEENETDDVDTLGYASPQIRAVILPRVDGDSTTTTSSMSPELRSPGELNLPRSESGSPRPFRGWDTSSPSGPRLPSDIEIMPNPGGVITIGLGSTSDSSLYDPDENNDDFLDADGPDDYEFTEMQRTLLDRQLHLLEDEDENQQDVDVVNDDGTPVHLPGRSDRIDPYVALSQAAMRVNATRMRWQAMRHGRREPSSNAVRQAELRVMEQSFRDFQADAQLIAALHRLQRIADRQTRDREPEHTHEHADDPPPTHATNPPPPETESEYSTPPANNQPEEPEFLEPNEPDPAHSPTIHPIYHIDMSEPEFLVPINNLRNRLNYAPNNDLIINEQETSSPDADRLIINEDVDFFSYSDSERANDSAEHSGYLTPFTRNRDDIDQSTLSIERTESNEFINESPRVDNNDSTGSSSPLEFAMQPLYRVEKPLDSESLTPSPDMMEVLTYLPTVLENMTETPEAPRGVDNDDAGPSSQLATLKSLTPSPDVIEILTPAPDASQLEAMTSDLESEHLRQCNESNEETEINLPTEPKNEIEKPETLQEEDSNGDMEATTDLAVCPQQNFEKSLDSSESLTLPPDASQREPTPLRKTEPSHAQSLQCLSEGNEDTQTNPPIVPENETENENVDSISSNQDAAIASAQAPMDSVFEHFESNWAPVFREDEAAQARPSRPQEPFSDAYLSGMPSRKRRCVRESRPDPSLEGLMTEGVGATGVGEARTAELREFLRESVRSLVRHRSQREPENFSTSQFQSTAAFIDADKPTKDDEETEEEAAATSEPPQDDVE